MKAEGRANDEAITDWSKSSVGYQGKARLIRGHFDEIAQIDAVLVTNYAKHGKTNYIGPNVLMEMAIGFYLNKPIYVSQVHLFLHPLAPASLGAHKILTRFCCKMAGRLTGPKIPSQQLLEVFPQNHYRRSHPVRWYRITRISATLAVILWSHSWVPPTELLRA